MLPTPTHTLPETSIPLPLSDLTWIASQTDEGASITQLVDETNLRLRRQISDALVDSVGTGADIYQIANDVRKKHHQTAKPKSTIMTRCKLERELVALDANFSLIPEERQTPVRSHLTAQSECRSLTLKRKYCISLLT
jgi:hypothetical protein